MTDLIDQLWEANREGWSLRSLAELGGVSKRQLIRNMHGQQSPQRSTQQRLAYALAVIAGHICQHLGCARLANYRLHLPDPIVRTERACGVHAQPLLGGRLPGITVEEI